MICYELPKVTSSLLYYVDDENIPSARKEQEAYFHAARNNLISELVSYRTLIRKLLDQNAELKTMLSLNETESCAAIHSTGKSEI